MYYFRLNILGLMAMICLACGTKVGNPSQNGTPKRTQASVNLPYSLPRLSFDFAAFFNDDSFLPIFALNDADRTVVQNEVKKLEDLLQQTDTFLEQFINQGVTETGSFFDIGPEKQFQVSVSETANSAQFQYQAVFCKDQTPFMEAFWNGEKTALKIVRTFIEEGQSSPYSDLQIYEISMNLNDGPSLEYYFQFREEKKNSGDGNPNRGNNNRPNLINQAIKYEYELFSGLIQKRDEKTTIIQTIESGDMNNPGDAIEAKEYLVGAVISGERSEFIRYKKNGPECNPQFDENADNPEWCQGGDIKSSARTFGANEAKETWQRLKPYGLRKKDKLRQPAFVNQAGACPK